MKNNSKLNIVILDDEEYACKYLKSLIDSSLNSLDGMSDYVVNYFTNFNDFKNSILNLKPKIIFLDYQMPTKNGIECVNYINSLSKELGESYFKPETILITAHSEFAFEAYQNDVYDYILKPCSLERINKLFSKLITDKIIKLNADNFIIVQNKGLNSKLFLDEILFVKAEMKYLTVYTKDQEYIISGTLSDLSSRFSNLIRVHRGYLINKKYINKFFSRDGHWYLSVKNSEQIIPVSRRHKSDLDGSIEF